MSAVPQGWAEGIRQLHEQGQGALALQVVLKADVPELLGFALAGGADAARVLRLVNHALAGIIAAPASKPMLCASCPRPLDRGRFAVVALFPTCDDPGQGLALAVCQRCATTRTAIEGKAVQALRLIWPDGRAVTITHPEGGRA